MRFDRFTTALLYRRPGGPELTDDEADALQDAHLEHLAKLHEAGQLLAAGPLAMGNPDEELRGLSILKVGVTEARALTEADPAVEAGVFSLKLMPWMVPAGAMSFSATRFPHTASEATAD
jgi:uncharacterized protein